MLVEHHRWDESIEDIEPLQYQFLNQEPLFDILRHEHRAASVGERREVASLKSERFVETPIFKLSNKSGQIIALQEGGSIASSLQNNDVHVEGDDEEEEKKEEDRGEDTRQYGSTFVGKLEERKRGKMEHHE